MFLPKNNLAYPVLVKLEKSKGSGFYLNTADASYLVTAKHVLYENGLQIAGPVITITSLTNDLNHQMSLEVDYDLAFANNAIWKSNVADVAVIKIGQYQNNILHLTAGVQNISQNIPNGVGILGLAEANTIRFSDVEESNSVFMFAYPLTLGTPNQFDTARPLLRKGIVAGKTEDRRIIIDCASYFGNSGGLVLEVKEDNPLNRQFWGIGIVVESIPLVEELWNNRYKKFTSVTHTNSGYSIVEPMDRIFDLLAAGQAGGN